MKNSLQILWWFLPLFSMGQNILVDGQTYTPQELVEEILIDSNCIDNVMITNAVSGNFGGNDRSFGYFNANGSSFPFQSGIILSTGKISNSQGPNTSLSDDNAANWIGDNDLESVLNENNTINATILEFDFTSVASQISFRYIFASEEYQENNANTCQYSDLFGFLIRPISDSQYSNIALVPNTQTPVKVTTVHPEIQGGCSAINEFYFESWNGPASPINFNGQTKILTATAQVIPNETYHVKLVIADEQNYRYDSAVFLEAGSFQLSTDLGPNLLTSTDTALCSDENYTLNAFQTNAISYKWFKNTIELLTETTSTLTVNQAGVYNVQVTLASGCIAYGEAIIEYYPEINATDATLTECDQNQDGITLFDLYDAEGMITSNNQDLSITNFYFDHSNAVQNTNPISNPDSFQNSIPNEIVFVRVENQAGCFKIAQLQLSIASNSVVIPPQLVCDDTLVDGFTDFILNDITVSFQNQIPIDSDVSYYLNEEDAYNSTNNLSSPFQNTVENAQTLFVKIVSNNQCYALSTVTLQVLNRPTLEPDETRYYCVSSFPNTIRLYGGVLNNVPNNYYYEWLFNGSSTGASTTFIDVNEVGTYTVIVTNPNGCSASRIITVLGTEIPIIDTIAITQGSDNNTVTVQVSNPGSFEYALDDDNGFYQDSNVFTNVSPGIHTVFVRNINGCDTVPQQIAVLGFPKYFTPNGDIYHATWQPYGINEDFNQSLQIKIFDRFGKFIAHITNNNGGWDGTHNGKPLPSDDYWFVATLLDGSNYHGHFALVR